MQAPSPIILPQSDPNNNFISGMMSGLMPILNMLMYSRAMQGGKEAVKVQPGGSPTVIHTTPEGAPAQMVSGTMNDASIFDLAGFNLPGGGTTGFTPRVGMPSRYPPGTQTTSYSQSR